MDANSIQVQALVTFLVPCLLQFAKASQGKWFQWIDQAKPKICVLTAAFTALLTSTGIEIVHAQHSLTVTWPDGATVARGIVTFAVATIIQIAGQHALYGGFWKLLMPVQSNQAPGKLNFH
jgi:hypothetical protein